MAGTAVLGATEGMPVGLLSVNPKGSSTIVGAVTYLTLAGCWSLQRLLIRVVAGVDGPEAALARRQLAIRVI